MKFTKKTDPKTKKERSPGWYAVAANVVSFAVGVAIARMIPGIF